VFVGGERYWDLSVSVHKDLGQKSELGCKDSCGEISL